MKIYNDYGINDLLTEDACHHQGQYFKSVTFI